MKHKDNVYNIDELKDPEVAEVLHVMIRRGCLRIVVDACI